MGFPTRDDIDGVLAAEEHRQGRPFTADPDHCHGCAEVDQAWQQAVCEHAERIEVSALGVWPRRFMCRDCGDEVAHDDR